MKYYHARIERLISGLFVVTRSSALAWRKTLWSRVIPVTRRCPCVNSARANVAPSNRYLLDVTLFYDRYYSDLHRSYASDSLVCRRCRVEKQNPPARRHQRVRVWGNIVRVSASLYSQNVRVWGLPSSHVLITILGKPKPWMCARARERTTHSNSAQKSITTMWRLLYNTFSFSARSVPSLNYTRNMSGADDTNEGSTFTVMFDTSVGTMDIFEYIWTDRDKTRLMTL